MAQLTYFDIRGKAESIRLMLEDLQVDYVDSRIQSHAEWLAFRPLTPFGVLPILEHEGRIAEASAIRRYLARAFDLYGADERERTECDVAASAIEHAIWQAWEVYRAVEPMTAADTFASGTLPETLGYLERWLARGGRATDHWVGSRGSFVDHLAFAYLDELHAFFPRVLAGFSALDRFLAEFAERPRIAAYLASGRRPRAFGFTPRGLLIDPRC
jgi:glutathione S-transferase